MWRGNVEATQGKYTFRASSLTVHLDQISSSDQRAGSASAEGNSQTGGFELHADVLSYDLESGQIIGRRHSELRRGFELIAADQIIYQVAERRAIARPQPNGRVLVRFYSNPKQPFFPNPNSATAIAGASAAAE